MFANKTRAGVVLAGGVLALTLTAVAQTQTQSPPPAPAGQAGAGAPGLPGRGAPMWEADFSKTGTVPVLSPAEEAKRLWLPPGFKLELVLSDPDIQEPAQIAFDGNGRMFVLEIRGYMQDADATGELDPVGRISVHEDKDNDGVYETHTRLRRQPGVPALRDAVRRERDPDQGIERRRSLEVHRHQRRRRGRQEGALRHRLRPPAERRAPGSRLRAGRMDNWIYSTVNSFRVRWTPNGVLASRPAANGGQWGVTQDNYGKMWFQAGASGMPGYFQFPIALRQLHRTPTSSSRI